MESRVIKKSTKTKPAKELDEKLYTMYACEDALGEYWNTREEQQAYKDL